MSTRKLKREYTIFSGTGKNNETLRSTLHLKVQTSYFTVFLNYIKIKCTSHQCSLERFHVVLTEITLNSDRDLPFFN